jgi:hypothetical protein
MDDMRVLCGSPLARVIVVARGHMIKLEFAGCLPGLRVVIPLLPADVLVAAGITLPGCKANDAGRRAHGEAGRNRLRMKAATSW